MINLICTITGRETLQIIANIIKLLMKFIMFDTNTKMGEVFVQHLFLNCLVIYFFFSFITINSGDKRDSFAHHILPGDFNRSSSYLYA